MMTAADVERAFHVYLPDLQRVRLTKCYWPVLHTILALPDICGSLESPDGRSSAKRYREWCARHLPNPFLTPADRYKMRCAVLHQGSSLPDDDGVPSQYESFSFVDPDNAPAGSHGRVTQHATGLNLTADVAQLADEMVRGLRHWFNELQSPAAASRLTNVEKNLSSLVRRQPKGLPGFTEVVYLFQTTSST